MARKLRRPRHPQANLDVVEAYCVCAFALGAVKADCLPKQTLVADSTELVERVENALKVTDDVYLARVYSSALDIFRGRVWRGGIERKLAIIRETYAMLNDEAPAAPRHWRSR